MASTNIEWAESVWNPVAGCTRVSRGCDNCYAVKSSHRVAAQAKGRGDERTYQKYQGLTVLNGKGDRHFNGEVRCHDDMLDVPLKRKKPTVWFVNSMSDLFHPGVPFEFIDKVFAVMALCPQHTFQVLTKRPERAAEWLTQHIPDARRGYMHEEYGYLCDIITPVIGEAACDVAHERVKMTYHNAPVSAIGDATSWPWPLPNVMLGTSVEDQAAADERIPHLLRCPAAVRFLSCEPLLGAVDLTEIWARMPGGGHSLMNPLSGRWDSERFERLAGVRWIIVGGESGPGARPMHPDWARSIRDQCVAAGVAYFFKQWGDWSPEWAWVQGVFVDPVTGAVDTPHERMGPKGLPVQNGNTMFRVGKKAAGRELDGQTWDQMPDPHAPANP